MKYFVFVLFLFACSGNTDRPNTSPNINNNPLIDSFKEEPSTTHKIDTVSFRMFENLVKDEEDIPPEVCAAFLSNIDSLILASGTSVIGKGLSYRKRYKRFNLIYGIRDKDKADKAYNLILTYTLKNKMVDFQKFMYSCFYCGSKELWAEVQELDDEKTIIVRYFDPLPNRSMPSEETMIIRRKSTWMISPKGEINLLK